MANAQPNKNRGPFGPQGKRRKTERVLEMKKFEIGKWYYPTDRAFDPIQIKKRTACYLFVKKAFDGATWRMKIKRTEEYEYLVDSSLPERWRPAFTYRADRPAEEWS